VLMRGLEDVFVFFGGVPAEPLFDQMKAVIIEDERAIGGRPLENPEFVRFGAHWGFRIPRLSGLPREDQGQGGTADQVCPSQLLLRPELPQRRRLNAQALSWVAQTANVRIHRTTAEAPRVRLIATSACGSGHWRCVAIDRSSSRPKPDCQRGSSRRAH